MKKILALLLSLMMILSLAACGSKESEETDGVAGTTSAEEEIPEKEEGETAGGDVFKVGLITMVTGDAPTDGLRMQQAVELVINQVNEEGGINGMKVELDIQDDQCTTEGAINAMNKCISDGCQVVIGPHRSANAKAVSDIAKNAKIPYISGGTSPSLLDLNNEYLFFCRASDNIVAQVGGMVCKDTLNAEKVGILYCSDDFGTGALGVLEEYFQAEGVDYAAEVHNVNDTDMSGQLLNLVNAGCDALLIWTHDADMVVISRQINELGIELPVVSSGAPAMSTVNELMEPEWIEGWYVCTDYCSTATEDYIVEFKEAFNAAYDIDPEMFAASYYGAAWGLVDALERAGANDAAAIRDALATVTGIQGIVGKLNCDDQGAWIHEASLVQMDGNKQPQLVEVVTAE